MHSENIYGKNTQNQFDGMTFKNERFKNLIVFRGKHFKNIHLSVILYLSKSPFTLLRSLDYKPSATP